MALIRYFDPFKEFDERINDVLKHSPWTTSQTSLTVPVTDVYMEGDNKNQQLIIEAHLPSFSKDEVNVEAHRGAIEIRAERKAKEEQKTKRKYVLRESSSSFYRRVGLPKNIDVNKVKAEFLDGVLRISIPFKELPEPKKITIESKVNRRTN